MVIFMCILPQFSKNDRFVGFGFFGFFLFVFKIPLPQHPGTAYLSSPLAYLSSQCPAATPHVARPLPPSLQREARRAQGLSAEPLSAGFSASGANWSSCLVGSWEGQQPSVDSHNDRHGSGRERERGMRPPACPR